MKSKEFQLDIISADKKLFSGSVQSLVAPGISGKFGIYPDHAPMITALNKCSIVYKTSSDKEETTEVNAGIIEVRNNKVIICVR